MFKVKLFADDHLNILINSVLWSGIHCIDILLFKKKCHPHTLLIFF